MILRLYPSRLRGTVSVPPSKSLLHRELICRRLAGQTTALPPHPADDIRYTAAALAQLDIPAPTVYCGDSGSTLRFLIPLASLTGQEVTFTGRGRLMERPQSVYKTLYQQQGLRFEQGADRLTVEGALTPGEYELAGNVSSQFISGLLFALPLLGGTSTLHLIPPVESRSYIDMTRAVQHAFGVESRWLDENTLEIPGGQHYLPCDYTVEGDYSQAAFPAVLGAVTGGVAITGLSEETLQGDAAILEILRRCGARFTRTGQGVVFEKAPLHGTDIDLADCPDLGPVLMVLGLLGCDEKQSTALAADQGSDVMQVNWNWLYQYSPTGEKFVDLREYSDIIDLSQWSDAAKNACIVADSLQAVPISMTGRIFYWNMNTFKQAGIEAVPTSYDDLIAAGKAFQEKLGDDYYPLAIGQYDRMILMTFYLESKYGKAWVENNECQYTEEEVVDGLNFIKSLEDNHVIPTRPTMIAAGFDSIDKSQEWIDGKYAGILEWDSSANKYQAALADNSGFTVGEEIKFGDYNGGFSKVSMGLAITKTSKCVAEAATLINFLLNEEKGASIMGSECGIPASKAGLAAAQAAGAVKDLVAEANAKVMAFTTNKLDPLFENNDLKASGTGIYQEVFDTVDYDGVAGADVVDTLLDGMESVGYTIG